MTEDETSAAPAVVPMVLALDSRLGVDGAAELAPVPFETDPMKFATCDFTPGACS